MDPTDNKTPHDDSPIDADALVPWESSGLGAEPSEVEEPSMRERRAELAQKLIERDHPSAMLRKFSWFLNLLARFVFAHVVFERRAMDTIRHLTNTPGTQTEPASGVVPGNVVYLMRTRSLLDYLYFNWAFVQHDLPMARFANGMSTAWLRGFFPWLGAIFRRPSSEKPEELVQALTVNGEPVFLFLEEPKARMEDNLEFSQKFLYRLIRGQRTTQTPIMVLPMLLVWEKRPDSKHPTILDDIFGTAQSPGFFRKAVHWFQTIWQSFLKFGQPVVQLAPPVNLQNFLADYPGADTADASELLRQHLLESIEQEERVILGPTGERQETIWKDILTRPALSHAIHDTAIAENTTEEAVTKRAFEQFEEIAADHSLLMIKIFSSVLSFVWYRIYDGFEVDEAGLERVREAAKTSNIILIPSHKSHIDYLVLSYLFYKYGMTTPLIAAGVNLSFWPMGYLFRKAGAFFLRRTFKGDPLYGVVFREYVIRVLEEGYPLEFFIEGTRSRTGKLIKPRYGMLEMVLRAYTSGRLESVKIIPISVGYEKIIEEASYKQEILGGEKEKESLGGLLKAPRFLTSKYGRLYVEFNEPLDVGEYMAKYDLDPFNLTEEDLNTVTVRLAHRIIYDINEVTAVTPTALAATVLLNNDSRGIDRARLLREVGFLVHFLSQPGRQVRMSQTVSEALRDESLHIGQIEALRAEATSDSASNSLSTLSNVDVEYDVEAKIGQTIAPMMDRALDLFGRNDQIKVARENDSVIYSVPEEARLQLSFYRNNIVHHFVPEALLAAAIRSFQSDRMPLNDLMQETLFLSRLFKFEWIYEERAEFKNVFLRTLNYFEECAWVTMEEEGEQTFVRIASPTPVELEFFRRLVLTFLEAYAIVASMLEQMVAKPMDKKELLETALKSARSDYLKGRILFQESLSKPTYENAIRLLEDWKVIERVKDESKKRESYVVTPEYSENDAFRDIHKHLEAFVYPGRHEASLKLPLDDASVDAKGL